MLIRAERHVGGWYQGCAICTGPFLTMDPQPVLVAPHDERVGWICDTCLRLPLEDVHARMRRCAAGHRRHAERLETLSAVAITDAHRAEWAKAAAALPDQSVDPAREAAEVDRR